jgi:tetratricopeptide (TPR) repeat protein
MTFTRVRLSFFLISMFGASAPLLEQATTNTASTAYYHFGTVHFPVSCSPAAQAQFDIAVSMLHSFYYPETIKAFNEVTAIDPACAMAYWGIAVSERPNPLAGPFDSEALQLGFEAIQKGKSLSPKTQRERDWLAAAEPFFKDADKLDQKTRTKAYEKAMEQLYIHYPDDSEAAVFYALALNESADLADITRANQLKAAAILEKVKAQQPNHPGVAHYLIHSYDYAGLAELGKSAADQYAAIAPSSPHALHMPSHTYTILGMWEKSIESNKAALRAAKDYACQHYPPGTSDPSQPHFLDFMEYDYLQLGQDKQARALVEEAASLNKFPVMRPTVAFGLAAVPARYALERGAWADAAQLHPHESLYAYTQAITYFARAIGAAKSGNAKQAREDVEKLRAAYQSDLAKPDQAYWAGQSNILLQAASAWLARTEGNSAEGIRMMRSAADLEDASDKHVAMENRLFPMRELFGYMLLELKQPKTALHEFESSLKVNPNRLRGLYGAAKASEMLGDRETARQWYAKLITLTRASDPGRAELLEANVFLSKQ